MWPTIVESRDVPGINMIFCEQEFGSTVMWHFCLDSDRKTLHNRQILFTLTEDDIGASEAEEVRCLSRGELHAVGRFAWADFPFKHPLRQTDQPIHSCTVPNLLPVKWVPERKFVSVLHDLWRVPVFRSSHEHPHFVTIWSTTLLCVAAS